MKTKVLLADDHKIVLEGLRSILSSSDDIEVCGYASNGEEVLQHLSRNETDVVVLDINMPVMDGLRCARRIKKEFTSVKVIILTMYAQKSFLEEIIRIGVDGCLLKNNTGTELKDAILRVMQGASYFDRVHNFNTEGEVGTPAPSYKLSDREVSIIKLLAEGNTSAQIAEKLFISEHTVKTHRKNILRKTGVTSTASLVQFALNQGLM